MSIDLRAFRQAVGRARVLNDFRRPYSAYQEMR